MKTILWLFKYIVLPLSPSLVGITIRTLHQGQLTFESLNPAEVSFSMAMLSLIISMNASKLTNPHLRDAVVYMYQVAVILFLALFACAVFLQTDIEISLDRVWRAAGDSVKNNTNLGTSDLPEQIHQFKSILERLRIAALGLALIVIPLSLISNKKYDLEDL